MRTHKTKVAVLLLLLSGATFLGNLRAGQSVRANEKAPDKSAKTVAVLGEPFEIKIGKSVAISAQKLDVSFERVNEDSRCPKDVNCVWAGQISVIVGMKKAAKTLGTAQLTVQSSNYVTPKSIGKIGSYYVKLLEVAPERESRSSGTAQSVTLLVQKKPFLVPKNGK